MRLIVNGYKPSKVHRSASDKWITQAFHIRRKPFVTKHSMGLLGGTSSIENSRGSILKLLHRRATIARAHVLLLVIFCNRIGVVVLVVCSAPCFNWLAG